MIKLKPTTGTLAADATIPVTQVFNTNNKMFLSNNAVNIRSQGFVEVEGIVDITATVAGPIAVSIVVDGTTVSTFSAVAATIGDIISIPIYDLLRVVPTSIVDGFAKVSLQTNYAATVSGGVVSAKYIR